MEKMPNALEGINVVDLTQFAAGPICTLTLAQMGANIIKVERPIYGEQGRPAGGGQNKLWAILHANKKSITLNMKDEEGKELLRKLIKKSDVIIENFAPDTFERLGFDYEKIKAINPKCIFCQIKGYSEFSPYGKYPAFDGPVQATGTFASQTGVAGSKPVISNTAVADDVTGHYAVSAILAALFQRTKTGKGQHVRLNMQEVVISGSRMSFVDEKTASQRGGAMLFAGKNAPRDMYPTKKRFEDDENNYVFIFVRDSPKQEVWAKFCEVIERPDMIADPRFASGALRLENVEALNTEIYKWSMELDKEEVMKRLCENNIPAGAAITIPDVVNSPDMYESKFLQKINHPSLGEITLLGSAYHMSDTYVPVLPAPDLGQHNDEIYKGYLGMTDAEIQVLKEKGTI